MQRLINLFLFSVLLLPIAACEAEPEAQYKSGVHYEVLPQAIATADPNKIEVAEVFWYGCSHCFHFEELIQPWKKTLPEDVDFVAVPAVWAPVMELHAKAYYTAKALGVLDSMHRVIFEAMNLKKNHLKTESDIAALFIDQGVSPDRFTKVFNSWGVSQQAKIAESKQRGYRTQGTPELIVNGKYRVSARAAGGQKGMLKVAEFLIQQER